MLSGYAGGRFESIKLYARLFRQLFQGFTKIQSVNAAVKIENISRGLTAKAIKCALFLINGKGWFGFLVEWTGRDQTCPHGAHFHIASHKIGDTDAVFYSLDGVAVALNHAFVFPRTSGICWTYRRSALLEVQVNCHWAFCCEGICRPELSVQPRISRRKPEFRAATELRGADLPADTESKEEPRSAQLREHVEPQMH